LKKEKNGEVVMNKNTGRDQISLSSGLGPINLQNQKKKKKKLWLEGHYT
jgi:hypothetical protein